MVLTLAAVSLMLVDVRGGPTHYLRTVSASIAGPLDTWADDAIGSVQGIGARRVDPGPLHTEIEALRSQNSDLQLRVDQLEEELQGGAGKAPPPQLTTTPARVVASGPAYSRTMLTVAVGRDDGIRADTAVLAGGALVGRVVDVAATTSTVQLITDPNSSVAVRVQAARETAVAVGTGDPRTVELQLFDPLVAVESGERVVTLGSPADLPFPSGLVLGTVDSASAAVGSLDRVLTVRLAVGTTALDQVDIVTTTTGTDASSAAAGSGGSGAQDRFTASGEAAAEAQPRSSDDGASMEVVVP